MHPVAHLSRGRPTVRVHEQVEGPGQGLSVGLLAQVERRKSPGGSSRPWIDRMSIAAPGASADLGRLGEGSVDEHRRMVGRVGTGRDHRLRSEHEEASYASGGPDAANSTPAHSR